MKRVSSRQVSTRDGQFHVGATPSRAAAVPPSGADLLGRSRSGPALVRCCPDARPDEGELRWNDHCNRGDARADWSFCRASRLPAIKDSAGLGERQRWRTHALAPHLPFGCKKSAADSSRSISANLRNLKFAASPRYLAPQRGFDGRSRHEAPHESTRHSRTRDVLSGQQQSPQRCAHMQRRTG